MLAQLEKDQIDARAADSLGMVPTDIGAAGVDGGSGAGDAAVVEPEGHADDLTPFKKQVKEKGDDAATWTNRAQTTLRQYCRLIVTPKGETEITEQLKSHSVHTPHLFSQVVCRVIVLCFGVILGRPPPLSPTPAPRPAWCWFTSTQNLLVSRRPSHT